MAKRKQPGQAAAGAPTAEASGVPLEAILCRGPAVVFRWRVADGFPVDYVSANVAQFGYTPEDFLIGRVKWPAVTHPEDVARLVPEVERYLAEGTDGFSQHYRLRTAWGAYRHIRDWNRVVRNAGGEITHIDGLVLDVTDQVAVDEAYRLLVEGSIQGLAIVQDKRLVFANEALARLMDRTVKELQDLGVADAPAVMPPADIMRLVRHYEQRMAGLPAPHAYEVRLLRRDGSVRWVELHPERITYRGRPAIQAACVDITDRKAALAALAESEENFRALAGNATEAIVIETESGLVYWNPFTETLLGYSAGELAGLDAGAFVAPGERARLRDYTARRLAGGKAPTHYESVLIAKDGREIPVEVTAAHTRWHGKPATVGMLRDVSHRRRLERDTVEAASQEQQRVGRDIHDTLGQQLTGVSFLAAALRRNLAADGSPREAEAARLVDLIGHALNQTRRLAHGLSPVDPLEEGLAAGLQSLAEDLSEIYEVACECEIVPPGRVHDHAAAMQLFQIAREAATNAMRHAAPQRVTIRLDAGQRSRGRLTVTDDGTWRASGSAPAGGLGLRIMRYRAQIIGATLAVEHAEGKPTTVTCAFPNPQR